MIDQTEALRRAAIWLSALTDAGGDGGVIEVVGVDGVREVLSLQADLAAIEAHLTHLPAPLLVEWCDASEL